MNRKQLDILADENSAMIESDGHGFRRAARVLQALWRKSENLPVGEHGGKALGSRLETEFAKSELANYLTPTVRDLVRKTLASAEDGQLFAAPRIYNDLLSSQPLCFNLFGELAEDLDLATEVFSSLLPGSVRSVEEIRFEYSPGRGDESYTGDRSAFDVFVEYTNREGGAGFVGIEVKYHEDLKGSPAEDRIRYSEVAKVMGCFRTDALERLAKQPLQQIWRDHLLAGSMVEKAAYAEGMFVMLYPAANEYCRRAVREYRATLTDTSTFDSWTLEELVGVMSLHTSAPWVEAFRHRYLDFCRLHRS